ncbi:MAG: hypothetical protein ABSE49_35540, partial [Polyangiaceae bacterium]
QEETVSNNAASAEAALSEVSFAALLEGYALLVAHVERFPEARGAIATTCSRLDREGQRVLQAAVGREDVAVLGRFGEAVMKAKAFLATLRPDRSAEDAEDRLAAVEPSAASITPGGHDVVTSPRADIAPARAPLARAPIAPGIVPVEAAPVAPLAEPRLSLQQYASLRAECVGHPEGVAAVRARYGLDELADDAETEAWGSRFARDSALFDTYKAMFQRYRAMGSTKPPSAPPPPFSAPPAALRSFPGISVRTPVPSRAPSAPPPSMPSAQASVRPPSSTHAPSSRWPSLPLEYDGSEVVPTAALNRVLTLGEHATMAAELLFLPEETVYEKYDLGDATVRAHVLNICEKRIEDPTALETWKRLHDVALKALRSARK